MAWLRSSFVLALALVPSALLFGACDPAGKESGHDHDHDAEVESPDGEGDPDAPAPAARPAAAMTCDPDASWEGEACTTEDGQPGTSYCLVEGGEEFQTPCSTAEHQCVPGESWDMGCMGEICYWDAEAEAFRRHSWSEPNCETPLVVSFDGGPIEFAPAVAAAFDLSSDGTCTSTDWPTAPWLALDRDGDGSIRDGSELFGSATKMSAGGHAEHGFAALAELDSDRDGKITAADERFGELVLWSDVDDDRVGAGAELRPLRETSVVSIDLAFGRRASCDGHGNCGYERATLEYRTAKGELAVGEVVDVHLPCR
jgi:hypothetical protein